MVTMAFACELTDMELKAVTEVKAILVKEPIPSVATGDAIVNVLTKHGMAEMVTYPLDEIGVHDQNRNYVGIEAADMQTLV